MEFENVRVYGSDPFDGAANASYSNLCILQKPESTESTLSTESTELTEGTSIPVHSRRIEWGDDRILTVSFRKKQVLYTFEVCYIHYLYWIFMFQIVFFQ